MTNVQHKIEGNKLILTVDISSETLAKAEPSKSGKTKVVASTALTIPYPMHSLRDAASAW